MSKYSIGTCGISDDDWMGNFYPAGLHSRDRLAYYSTKFKSIEINTTYHATPKREYVRRWAEVTPADFRFSLKCPKSVTHDSPQMWKRISARQTLEHFLDVISELGEKLAVVLMQFPPSFSVENRSSLFQLLDGLRRPSRLVLEFRNDSWWKPEIADALRERDIGWAAAELGTLAQLTIAPEKGKLSACGLRSIISTADFLYVRWIGTHRQFPIHTHEYFDSAPRTQWWFERIERVVRDCDEIRNVYAFFDNDFNGHAPTAARRFAKLAAQRNDQASTSTNFFITPTSESMS